MLGHLVSEFRLDMITYIIADSAVLTIEYPEPISCPTFEPHLYQRGPDLIKSRTRVIAPPWPLKVLRTGGGSRTMHLQLSSGGC